MIVVRDLPVIRDTLLLRLLDQGKRLQRALAELDGLVRKLLILRFGELPADAEQRLERASLVKLERWAERVLTAKNLAAVFAD